MSSLIKNVPHLKSAEPLLSAMTQPSNVLMVSPDYFLVDYAINPYMKKHIGTVNRENARRQWRVVCDTFILLGLNIYEIPGQPGLPDMVFSANQSLPVIISEDHKCAIMSIMLSEHRREEVPYFEQWYRQNGYDVHYLDPNNIPSFEGMGDAIWHPGKRLLWGGYGYRTSPKAYQYISKTFDLPIVMLKLIHPAFYHLDTCFCALNSHTAMIYPPAFTREGLELIYSGFSTVIVVDKTEAEQWLACNAFCPDGQNVIIQKNCTKTIHSLEKAGFIIHGLDTSEFLKSGGSVFCMKLMLW